MPQSRFSHVSSLFRLAAVVLLLALPTAQTSAMLASADPGLIHAKNLYYLGQVGGSSYAIAYQNGYAYLGIGPRLCILDVHTAPGHVTPPLTCTEARNGLVEDIVISTDNHTAFVAMGTAGLRIFDVSSPANPHEIASYYADEVNGLALNGSTLYLAGSQGLTVLNVTNPASPQYVTLKALYTNLTKVISYGYFVYAIQDTPSQVRLITYFVLDPAAPAFSAALDLDYASNLAIGLGHLFVAEQFSGVGMYSLGSAPALQDAVDTPNYALDVIVVGSYIYAADSNAVITLHLATSDDLVSDGATASQRPSGLAADSSYLYVAEGANGMNIFNLQTPAAPNPTGGFLPDNGEDSRAVLSGGNLLLVDRNGLLQFDASNPAQPVFTGRGDSGGHTPQFQDVAVSNDGLYAYVADQVNGLFIYDLFTTPGTPYFKSHLLPVDGTDYGVAYAAANRDDPHDYAFLAAFSGGLRKVNVDDPAVPVEAGHVDVPGNPTAVTVYGSHVYVGTQSAGMYIYDRTTLAQVGSWQVEPSVEHITIVGNVAYLCVGYPGVYILNIADPQNIYTLYSLPDLIYAGQSSYSGGFLFVSQGHYGLSVVDVRNPANPLVAARLDPAPSVVAAVAARMVGASPAGGFDMWIANADAGLLVMHYQLPLFLPFMRK